MFFYAIYSFDEGFEENIYFQFGLTFVFRFIFICILNLDVDIFVLKFSPSNHCIKQILFTIVSLDNVLLEYIMGLGFY